MPTRRVRSSLERFRKDTFYRACELVGEIVIIFLWLCAFTLLEFDCWYRIIRGLGSL